MPDVARSSRVRIVEHGFEKINADLRTVVFVYEISKKEGDRKCEHSTGVLNRLVSKNLKWKWNLKQLDTDHIRNDEASHEDAA